MSRSRPRNRRIRRGTFRNLRIKPAAAEFWYAKSPRLCFTNSLWREIPMNKTLLSVGIASLFTALAGSAMALEQRPILTLEVAKKMAVACEAKAKQEGWKMNIAIVDNGGKLENFLRQGGAFPKSIG